MLTLPAVLLSAALHCLLTVQASAQGAAYKCPAGSQRILTNYGGYTFQLDVSPASSSYLQPNMDCGILIVGYTSNRWLITIDSISLAAYQAELVIQDGSTGGKQLISVTGSGTPYRQVGTSSGSFNVRLTTKSGPSGLAQGVRLTVELLDQVSCPSGWFTGTRNTGYCYGVPKLAGNLTYDEATKGCNMVLANLVMGNSEYDSISSTLAFAPSTVLNYNVAYWVGLYYTNDNNLKFLNKYNTLDDISGRLCSKSSSSCNCVAYQGGRFYQDDCSSKRLYVCYMPRGGTSSYYDVSNLLSTATSIISVVAIVLTVCFILAVIISLTVVLVCCVRRNSAQRRTRRRDAAAAAGANGFVLSGPGPVIAGSSHLPPPYPLAQAPPYTIEAAVAAAPPYSAVYANVAFDAGATAAGEAEKPPAYNPAWNGGQTVPA